MTFGTYALAAVVIDAFAGLGLGLAFKPQRSAIRVGVLLASFAAAFVGMSGLVAGYEVAQGEGLDAGLAWAAMYSLVNFALSAGAPLFCLVGILLRQAVQSRIRRCR